MSQKAFFLILFIAIFGFVSSIDPDQSAWEDYKARNNKHYASKEEEDKAFLVFIENQKIANRLTTKADPNVKEPARFSTDNEFGDLTFEEFKKTHLGRGRPPLNLKRNTLRASDLSYSAGVTSVDWRTSGKLTPVRQQGNCGSCWTYASTGALEAYYAIVTGNKPQHFSTQQMVDCVTNAYGCNGGWAEAGYTYASKNGITFDSNYPYVGQDGSCRAATVNWRIDSYGQISPRDEQALMAAVQKQPVSVAVAANQAWQLYRGGIMSSSQCSNGQYDLNHAVLLVGYDDNSWIVRNSWGTGWGEAGYIRLARGNTCGVTWEGSWPIKNGATPTPSPDPQPQPDPEPQPEPEPLPVCNDKISASACSEIKGLGYCDPWSFENFSIGYKLCKNSCNVCKVPDGSECRDVISNCSNFLNYCNDDERYYQYYCAYSCGRCKK